jgi:hypothetical protein
MTVTETSAGSSSRIPGWLDEFSASWLTHALRSTQTIDRATTVSEVSWELLGDGEGFIGDLARIQLSYDGGTGPATAVVKVPTRKPENRGFGMLAGQYENEVRFYNELAAAVPVRTPIPYYAEIEANPRSAAIAERVLDALPERVTLWLLDRLAAAAGKSDRRAIVMMEDLGTARIGDQVGGASLEDAERSIDMVAEFHAAFWNSPRLNQKWLTRQDDTVLVTHGLFERAWPVFEAKFRDQITGDVEQVLAAIRERGPALLKRVCQGPLTLLHGDFRMDNIAFFDGDSPPVGMIDFQAVNVGHPLTDVAYYLRPNLDPDLADEVEDDLLRRYHAGLVRHGVTDYSLETLEREYGLAQLWLLHIGVILLGTLDLGEGRGAQIVEHAIERGLRVSHRLDPDAWF